MSVQKIEELEWRFNCMQNISSLSIASKKIRQATVDASVAKNLEIENGDPQVRAARKFLLKVGISKNSTQFYEH